MVALQNFSWMWFRRWFVYNALGWPVIAATYLPYYVLVVHFDMAQLVVWAETSFLMGSLANVTIYPWERWIVKRVDKWFR